MFFRTQRTRTRPKEPRPSTRSCLDRTRNSTTRCIRPEHRLLFTSTLRGAIVIHRQGNQHCLLLQISFFFLKWRILPQFSHKLCNIIYSFKKLLTFIISMMKLIKYSRRRLMWSLKPNDDTKNYKVKIVWNLVNLAHMKRMITLTAITLSDGTYFTSLL